MLERLTELRRKLVVANSAFEIIDIIFARLWEKLGRCAAIYPAAGTLMLTGKRYAIIAETAYPHVRFLKADLYLRKTKLEICLLVLKSKLAKTMAVSDLHRISLQIACCVTHGPLPPCLKACGNLTEESSSGARGDKAEA